MIDFEAVRRQEEETKQIVTRLFDEVWNRHQTQVLDEIMSETHEIQVGTEHIENIQGFRELVKAWYDGFPDMHYFVEEIFVSGSKAAVRWAARGTHLGVFMGIAPTKKQLTYWGINLVHLHQGKIVKQWCTADWEDLMAALTGRKAYCMNPVALRHVA